MKKMRIKIIVSCFLVLFLGGTVAMAADWPTRQIRFIRPQAAGGSDIVFRFLQPALEKELGVPIILENAPGGSTKIGITRVMKADPDGYTLLFYAGENWVSRVYSGIFETRPWDEMTSLGKIGTEPHQIYEVLANGPYKTWADFVRIGKEKGKITSGTSGGGGIPAVVMDIVNKKLGLNIVEVPFDGSSSAEFAFLGGHVDMRTAQPSEAMEMIKAGKTRAIVISTAKRVPYLPDTPTFKELGIFDGSLAMSPSFWGPANLPAGIANKFEAALAKAVKDPNFIKKSEEAYFSIQGEYRTGKQWLEEVRAYDRAWGPLFKEAFKPK
jgi:tripartite-type tricarboxylate transporter receptor subunit TctC